MIDFGTDFLFILRLGVGQPFQKIAELIERSAGGR
jgi:hypothetical protein